MTWYEHMAWTVSTQVGIDSSSLVTAALAIMSIGLGFAAWTVKQLMEVTKLIAVLVSRVDAHEIDIDRLTATTSPWKQKETEYEHLREGPT